MQLPIWLVLKGLSGQSGRLRTQSGPKQFQQVVRGADQLPFRAGFAIPRSRKARMPRAALICPKTGSTIALRILYSA